MISFKNETQLAKILYRYSSENNNPVDILLSLEEKLRQPSLIMPVLGTQGTGKSTLINALLGEDILPGEADETTCVPVEIRYGPESKGEVFFQNHQTPASVSKKEELAQYVDNNFNPGNKLKVERILLQRNHPLLKTGATIVDLPGVGSLTRENESTTMEYIKRCAVVIFLISTCPPILQREADFIRNVWRGVNSAFFVQNIWDDNSPEEVKEGLDHNQIVIQNLASLVQVTAVPPIPVNVYAAAKGAFTEDAAMIEKSQLSVLIRKLEDFSVNYSKRAKKDYERRIAETIASTCAILEDRIKKAKMSADEFREKIIQERREFERYSEEIDAQKTAICRTIRDTQQEVDTFSSDLGERYSKLLKVEVDRLIDNGVVDGTQLTEAFSDLQSKYASQALDEAYDKMVDLLEKLQLELGKFAETLQRENMHSPDAAQFNKEQAFKWEKGVNISAKVAGTAGGIFLGGIVEAAVSGAIGGSAGGPIGIAAGILVGIAVSIFGSKIGSASQDAVMRKRGRAVKDELSPYITKFRDKLKKSIRDYYKEYTGFIDQQLADYTKARDTHLDDLRQAKKDLERNGNRYQEQLEAMEQDLKYLTEWRAAHEQIT